MDGGLPLLPADLGGHKEEDLKKRKRDDCDLRKRKSKSCKKKELVDDETTSPVSGTFIRRLSDSQLIEIKKG